MTVAGAVAAGVVGLVLLWAAAAKLGARGWVTSTAAATRLPGAILAAIPLLELAIGARLIGVAVADQSPDRLGSLAAACLVGAFTGYAAQTVVMHGEDGPPCACFGRAATPITWRVVSRNAVLSGLALFAFVVAG